MLVDRLLRTTRASFAGIAALALTAVAVPAAPAQANTCGGSLTVLCLGPTIHSLPDVTGEAKGVACGTSSHWVDDEGGKDWWTGPIVGATYLHPDAGTRRMWVVCSVRNSPSYAGGTLRGSTRADSVAPLNNVVSAAGLNLQYWTTYGIVNEAIYGCTTVGWVDKFGLTHTRNVDYDATVGGDQCGAFIWLPV